jgi:replicative DNA helicase
MAEIKGKKTPHNLEAEQSILGSMIMEEKNIPIADEYVTADDFFSLKHQEIYKGIFNVHQKGQNIDVVTLKEDLENRNVLKEIGGPEYLTHLITIVPIHTNIRSYCEIVRQKSVLRSLIKASSEIIQECYENQDDVEAILETAEKKIFDISQYSTHRDFEPMSAIVERTMKHIDELKKNRGSVTGVASNIEALDRCTSGFQKSDLIILAARPSMGKTALALNIAQDAAIRDKKKVAIFSLEMSKEQLVQRMLCTEALVDSQRVRTGNTTIEDYELLGRAYSNLYNAEIYIDDTPGITLTEMRSKCRKLKIDKGIDMVLIDYLQLMGSKGRTENRTNEISEISRGLKALAREMECPVITLSQLSRAVESRKPPKPILSDLRESGAIEQDADVVMMLYRESYYEKEIDNKGLAELNVAKQRNGPTEIIPLAWLDEYTKFTDRNYGQEENYSYQE